MTWALFGQIANPEAAPFWPTLGIGGGIAVLVLSLWRVDRKDSQERYAALAKESQERYAALAEDSNRRAAEIAAVFRSVIEDNTKAMTALTTKIDGLPDRCSATELLVEIIKTKKPVNLEP
jgi:uncharacterized protein (DUF2384 family)